MSFAFARILRDDDGRDYASYDVFYSLVELSGFPVVSQSEIPWDDPNQTIIVNPLNGAVIEWLKRPRKCKIIAWQMERFGKWNTYQSGPFAPTTADQVWVSDRALAQQLIEEGNNHVSYVPVGGHAGLGGNRGNPHYDLVPLCYQWGERKAKIDTLAKTYSIAPNGWGADRDAILASSRVGLNLHQWPDDFAQESLRLALFACWKLPIVSEFLSDPYPFACYSLAEIDKALTDERHYARENYRTMCESMTFRRCVEGALV
jgi:hypothetical protein